MAENSDCMTLFSEQEAKAFLAAIVESTDESIVGKTLDGIIVSWNRGAEAMYGYPAEEVIGRHFSMVVPEDRRDELVEMTETLRRGERVERVETERIRKDGKRINVALTLSPIFGENGEVTGISTIGRDITEKVAAERILRESEKRYRSIVEMARDAVVVHQGGHFVYANCAALGIYGAKSIDELQQTQLIELVHPEEREEVQDRLQQLLEGEEIPLREYRLLRLDGQEVPIETSSTVIDYEGTPSIQIIARDITERKRAEAEREKMLHELEFEQGRFEAVVRQMPMGLVITEGGTGKLLYDNEEARRIFRTDFAEIAGVETYHRLKMFDGDGRELPEEEYPVARAALKGETVVAEEYQIVRGDGSRRYLTVNAAPIRDSSGKTVAGLAVFSDTTEKKEAEKALADSKERLKLALDAAEMGSCDMLVKSGEGLWSRRHFTLMGYPDPRIDSAPATIPMWLERIHPDDREQVIESLEQSRREQKFFRSEHRILRVDNEAPLWVNVMGRFLCDQSGAVCRFIGVIFDVSERKAKEQALRRSERRFHLIADSLPQLLWTANPDGGIDYLNAYFQSYTGIDRDSEEIRSSLGDPGAIASKVIHRDDTLSLVGAWYHSVSTGTNYQAECRIKRADGAYHWHLCRAIPDRDESGEIVKWYGTATDVNDLREMQEQLRVSEAKFRRLYESNIIAVFFWNKNGRITEANEAFCELLGYCQEDCRKGNISWLQITPDEERVGDVTAVQEIISSGVCKPYERTFINRRDDRRVPVLIAGARISVGEADGIGFAVDLTELKRTEEALKNSEAQLKLAIETTGLGIFDWDLDTGKQVWSDIAKEHYGLSRDSEVNEEIHLAAVHPDDRERVEQAIREALKPEVGALSLEYRTIGLDDGKLRWLTARGRVYFDQQSHPRYLSAACLDITDIVQAEKALKDEVSERLRAVEELRKQEQLLIRQGRLAAMGEMIGNIAHQWRQPLNTLGLIIQELPRIYERNLFSKEYLENSVSRAMQVINYMSKTIDGFRNFFGPDKEKETFNVAELIARTVSIVEAAFKQLKLVIEVEADPGITVFGYPNEFSQVILNLLVNAKDAILERKVAHPKVAIRLFRENEQTVLTITDNAGGVPPEIIEKIFDPYFTTKGPDKGTGIGLFMSKTIIEKNMNGSLTVRNTDEGAEFRIEI